MRNPIALASITLGLLALAACGGGGGGGSSSAAAAGSDVVLTPDPDFSSIIGSSNLTGTVTLPASVPAGRAVQLTAFNTTAAFSEVQSGSKRAAGTTITYRAGGISAGAYKVRVRVDVNGNGAFNDAVDYDGWYAGSVATPQQSQLSAPTVAVPAGGSATADFGINTNPPPAGAPTANG